MVKSGILLVNVVVFLQLTCGFAGKAGNEVPSNEERKFRSGKVQQVWEKANRMKISPVKMTDLYADLKHHDQLMMEYKQTKNREDDDGLREAELIEKLHEIMDKYGITGKRKISDKFNKPDGKRFLEDPKLENLWKTAERHGKFDDKELEALEMEFTHHKRKVEEFEILKSETEEFDDLSDNLVEKEIGHEDHVDKKQKLEELHEDIKEGYERLKLKTKQGTLSDHAVPFTEPRVAELWEEAKKGNFTKEELKSIKEELKHFQTRVEKHLFFRDQLKNSIEKIKFHGGEDNVPKEHATTHNHLQSKVQDLAAKVKKLHHELAKKLSSKQAHGEL